MAQSIVVYGPQGCGKTRNAARLKKALGLKTVIDGWSFGSGEAWPREGALLLTNEKPPDFFRYPVLSFDEAMRRARS